MLLECHSSDWSANRTCTVPYNTAGVRCSVPIQGGWSSWSISSCSSNCIGGMRQHRRTCTNPSPQNGGEFCIGRFSFIERCGSLDCVIPIAVKQPTDTMFIVSGSSVNFTCAATGKPRPAINWFRNDNKLLTNHLSDGGVPVIITNSIMGNCTITDPPSQCVSSSTLQILNTRAVDSGEYTCIASNEAGSDTVMVNLIVNVIPIVEPLVDRHTTSGEDVNFTCTATGTPQAVISWLRNNNVLISSNSLSDGGVPVVISNSVMGNCTITDPPSQCVSSSTLQILNTRAVDSGEYTCIASNEVGRDTAIFNVIVNVFPVITHPPVDVNANLSEEVNLTCIAIAKPQATIYWIKNMKTVIGNHLGRMVSNSVMGNCTITDPPSQCVSSSTLQILNTRAVDSGEYTCVASNEVGNDTVTAQLIIDGLMDGTGENKSPSTVGIILGVYTSFLIVIIMILLLVFVVVLRYKHMQAEIK
ncbi:peroxidasin-like [Dysidea avara]|uniref:peroxidasin-like n=1 Tax=Dysidea avara TaxID=196820 RepID=UPI00332E9E97